MACCNSLILLNTRDNELCVVCLCVKLYRASRRVAIQSVDVLLALLLIDEAAVACTWLRDAGFPQYAQLYEGTYHNYDKNNRTCNRNN